MSKTSEVWKAEGEVMWSRFYQRLLFATTRILAYHSVHPERRDILSVHPDDFRRQMEWLASLGWRGVSLAEFVHVSSQQGGTRSRVFGITFDDGYADSLYHALPVLQELGFSATVFVIVDRIGTDVVHSPRWLTLYPEVSASAYRYLTWEEVQVLRDAGIEIGAHTCTHPFLDRIDYRAQFREIALCRIKLEQAIGGHVVSFCYPAGRYNGQTLELVRACGYRQAVLTPSSIRGDRQPDPYLLRRAGIYHTDSLMRFQLKCTPLFDFVRTFGFLHPTK